jgi:single-strand DNA-binding protein
MPYFNKTMLIGRLCAVPDPPMSIANGSRVIRFRIACGRSKKNKSTGQWENDPNPLFIDCEAWERPGSSYSLVQLIQQYGSKGTELFLEGRLQLDQWDDKQTGQKRSKHKITVDNIQFLSRQDSQQGGNAQGRQASAPTNAGSGYSNPDADASGDSGYSEQPSSEGDQIPF